MKTLKVIIEFLKRDWQRTKVRHAQRKKIKNEYWRYRNNGFDHDSAKFRASLVL